MSHCGGVGRCLRTLRNISNSMTKRIEWLVHCIWPSATSARSSRKSGSFRGCCCSPNQANGRRKKNCGRYVRRWTPRRRRSKRNSTHCPKNSGKLRLIRLRSAGGDDWRTRGSRWHRCLTGRWPCSTRHELVERELAEARMRPYVVVNRRQCDAESPGSINECRCFGGYPEQKCLGHELR